MPDAARDARIWLVHVMEIADHEVPDALESAGLHIRRLLAENERLEAMVEQYQTDLAETEQGTPVGGRQMTVMENWWMNEKGKREQLEAQKLALVAYVRVLYDIQGKNIFGNETTVYDAWQALGAELQEAIDG